MDLYDQDLPSLGALDPLSLVQIIYTYLRYNPMLSQDIAMPLLEPAFEYYDIDHHRYPSFDAAGWNACIVVKNLAAVSSRGRPALGPDNNPLVLIPP